MIIKYLLHELISTVFENHRKVSFNIASEARYAYICRGQKFIENVQKVHIDADESAEVQFGNETENQK